MRKVAMKFVLENVKAADEIWVVTKASAYALRDIGYDGPWHVMENGTDFARGKADPAIAAELRAAMDAMVPLYVLCHNEQNADAADGELGHIFAPKGAIVAVKDDFGSPYDPRRVSVAEEVAKVKAALSAATDAYAAKYGKPEDAVTAVCGLYPTDDAAACVNIPVALRGSVAGVAFADEGVVRVTFVDGTAADVPVAFAAAPVFEGSESIYDL
jgi:hypothetical protein